MNYPALKVAREMVVKEDTTIKAFCQRYIQRAENEQNQERPRIEEDTAEKV
jgi:hypothetical protein